MDHKEKTHLHLVVNNTTPELESVAARIHPLPQDVAPSEEFLTRTRLRLLQTDPVAETDNSRRAA